MIILDTLSVRPISQVLDGSKAQAVKISAAFGGNPRQREIEWIKPSTFERVSGVALMTAQRWIHSRAIFEDIFQG